MNIPYLAQYERGSRCRYFISLSNISICKPIFYVCMCWPFFSKRFVHCSIFSVHPKLTPINICSTHTCFSYLSLKSFKPNISYKLKVLIFRIIKALLIKVLVVIVMYTEERAGLMLIIVSGIIYLIKLYLLQKLC